MVLQIIKKSACYIGIVILMGLNSCYYDSVEELYPQPPDCDTSNVTFSNSVLPVINSNCTSCHSGSAPSGNLNLTNYDEIVAVAQNGSLLGAINHESGWSPMPKNGNKLDNCSINKIEYWVSSGYPNN